MEKTSTLVNDIYSKGTEYLNLQAKSAKLELYERITNIIASGISSSFIIGFTVLSALFISLGLAFWLSEIFNSNTYGFFAVGGFYIVLLGIYLLTRNKVAKNKVKNAVLHKVSKSHDDYDALLKEQASMQLQVEEKEKQIKGSFDELKENLETLKDDFRKLKSHFVSEEVEEGEEKVGPKLPRIAITSIIDLLMRKVLLRHSGLIKKTVFPILANALVTSTVFKENKKTSLIENLRLKFSKFLS